MHIVLDFYVLWDLYQHFSTMEVNGILSLELIALKHYLKNIYSNSYFRDYCIFLLESGWANKTKNYLQGWSEKMFIANFDEMTL